MMMYKKIEYQKFTLDNGLTCILHQDLTTPLVGVSMVYKVGSRNESPQMTGLAHLFEHLMFSGTKYIKDFDIPLQRAGGDGNAYTNQDITNFYCSLPAENLEVAFWLESARIEELKISKRKLNTQKKVVIEEFKETCLDEPYGDVWHHISKACYQEYPYQWPVIGLELDHVARVEMEDAMSFYQEHYTPKNAILALSGKFDLDHVKSLIEKWFAKIPSTGHNHLLKKSERTHKGYKKLEITGNGSNDTLYLCFLMCERNDPRYYAVDLLSDLLGSGKSSLLYAKLVKETAKFLAVDAYVTSTDGPGLLIIEVKPHKEVCLTEAEALIWALLDGIKKEEIPEETVEKLKNKTLSSMIFSELSPSNMAINLACFEALGDVEEINREVDSYLACRSENLQEAAKYFLDKDNCVSIHYKGTNT